jgi:proline iminopeptidase
MAAILESGDRRGLLRKIRIPTLVIHGKADVLIPVESGIDIANNIKDSTLHLVEGMGHDLPKQIQPRLAQWITDFIQEKRQAA